MATYTFKAYGRFAQSLANGEIDLDSDNLKAMLCAVGYVPDQDVHRYKSDVTNEVAGAGYTAGGVDLTGVTVSYNAATNSVVLDAADPVWPDATITARVVVIYDATPATDATRPLIAYGVFSENVSATAGDFTVTLPIEGIVSISAAA